MKRRATTPPQHVPRRPGPPFWPAMAGVALVALAIRLAYVSQLSGSPLLMGLMGDSRQYDAWALQIAGGQWLGTEVFYQTPLYPYWLGVIFSIVGHSLDWVRGIQAVLGAASCVLLGLAGRQFLSERIGIIAALLLALYPPAIFFDGLIQKSALDAFLVTLMLAVLAAFVARPHGAWLATLGAVVALLTLNRENARVLYVVLGAWLWFGFRDVPPRRRVRWCATVAVASLAILLPVGVRNYVVGGEFLVSTSQLGPNFYIGNNPTASGSYEPLVPERGDALYERADATRLATAAAGRPLAAGEVSNYWLGRSLGYITNQPVHWLALLAKKAFYTLNAAELPDTESIEAYADYSAILKALIWLDFGIILPLAALGVWMFRAEWKRLMVLYGVFAGFAVAVALFYVVARYRYPLVPVVLLFSAAGLSAVPGLRQRPGWLKGLAWVGAVAALSNIPIHVVYDQTYLNMGTLLLQNGKAAEAIPMLAKAAAIDPSHAEPHYRLGQAHQESGNPQAAIEAMMTAARLSPERGDAHNALGLLLRGQNRAAEALAQFRDAARLLPDSVEAHTNLGLALTEAGLFNEATASHRRAVALAPQSASPHNNLAVALQQAGDVRQAIVEYRKALAITPDDVEAHGNLALTLGSMRDFEAAFVHFREAVRLAPANPEIRVHFGNALCEAGQRAACSEQFEVAVRLFAALPADTPGRAEAIRAVEDALRR